MAIGWPEDTSLVIPPEVHTLTNFLRWAHSDEFPESGNIAFIGGELVIDMSPERIESHAKVKGEIYSVLSQLARTKNSGEALPDGVLLVNEAANLACEPDVTYCRWETLQSGRAQYRESKFAGTGAVELSGSPDLVVEVISNSSVRKDKILLLSKYFEAGIEEYWLVDARKTSIELELFVRGSDEFELIESDADGYLRSIVFDRSFKLTRTTTPVGGVDYRLLHR